MMYSYNKTHIFDRFNPHDKSLIFRFDIYQYGDKIDSVTFKTYEDAQKFFYRHYQVYECGEKLYIDDEYVSFVEAYEFFKLSELNSRLWGRD